MNTPQFSIITICYNSADTIERTIKSVLAQTFVDYEYIIVDGASTDNTLEIVNQYQKSFGNKLRVSSEPDKGIYDAMNKGVKAAKGKIIGIVNSDDWLDIAEIVQRTGRNRNVIYSHIKNHNVPIVLNGRRRLIYYPALLEIFK